MISFRHKLEALRVFRPQTSPKKAFFYADFVQIEDGMTARTLSLFDREIQQQILINSMAQSTLTNEQMTVWVRGLLSIAWADGDFDEEEKTMISTLTHMELETLSLGGEFSPISPADLGAILGEDVTIAENFLRTGFMVALADGIYSACEDDLLHKFSAALGLRIKELEALRHHLEELQKQAHIGENELQITDHHSLHIDVLKPAREWLDGWEIHDPRVAHLVCKMIPAQCPFERDIVVFGRKIAHIPPMCKINPLYEQLMGLRFRALSYLADDCHEDISPYC